MIGPLVRLGTALAVRPHAVVRRGASLAGTLLRTGPTGWPAAVHVAAEGLVDDARLGGPDGDRLRGLLDGLLGAPAAPSVRTSTHGGERLRVGRDVGTTEGAVVLRTPAVELVQYLPRTERVHEVPLLVVPPPAQRPWLVDLGPGRSAVEHLVRHGVQVFALSWRDRGAADPAAVRDAVAAARDACARVTRSARVSLLLLADAAVLVPAAGVATVTVAVPAERATGVVRAWRADRVPVPAALRAALDASPRVPAHRVDARHRVDGAAPWWPGWTAWLTARSGGPRDAPPELGGRGLHPLAPAPAEPPRL